MDKAYVSKATLGRLPRYLEFLQELSPVECPYISATTIAKQLMLGEVQVRKDLRIVSGAGKPKLGYVTSELLDRLEECLGRRSVESAVLVGAGKLGRALLHFDEFKKYGVRIEAAFDTNPSLIQNRESRQILPMGQFESFCREHQIRLGIITVGEEAAQKVCDQMVQNGIVAIWNFAATELRVPEGTLLHNENLALSLAHLNNQLRYHNKEDHDGKVQL